MAGHSLQPTRHYGPHYTTVLYIYIPRDKTFPGGQFLCVGLNIPPSPLLSLSHFLSLPNRVPDPLAELHLFPPFLSSSYRSTLSRIRSHHFSILPSSTPRLGPLKGTDNLPPEKNFSSYLCLYIHLPQVNYSFCRCLTLLLLSEPSNHVQKGKAWSWEGFQETR